MFLLSTHDNTLNTPAATDVSYVVLGGCMPLFNGSIKILIPCFVLGLLRAITFNL